MASAIIISSIVDISIELEKEVTVLGFPLPDRAEISEMVHRILDRFEKIKAVTISKGEVLIYSFCRSSARESDIAELTIQDFRAIIPRLVPLAKIRHDEVEAMRSWANSHALSASFVQTEAAIDRTDSVMPGGRRITIPG
jgi:hypothetical protein